MPPGLRRFALPALGVTVHLLFLAVLYRQQGLLFDKEALKYLGAAQDLLHGDTTDLLGRYRLFATYILFLTPFVALGLPTLAVATQVVLVLFSARALHRLALRMAVAPGVALGVTAIYLLAQPLHTWTLSAYSEGLFVPLSVLFLERALRPTAWDRCTWLLALLLLFARPTGALFIAPLLLLRITASLPERTVLRSTGVIALVLAMLFLPVLNREQLQVVVGAPVVCGFPEHPELEGTYTGTNVFGAQLHLIDAHGLSYWVGLLTRRTASLLIPLRPYFSPVHNALNLPFVLLLPLVLWGALRTSTDTMRSIALILLLNILLVALTYDEWAGRFFAPLLPLLLVMGSMVDRPVSRTHPAMYLGSP
ncbi:MAG: hypothetical protein R2817_09860 [Flavobacteriales bacterium]